MPLLPRVRPHPASSVAKIYKTVRAEIYKYSLPAKRKYPARARNNTCNGAMGSGAKKAGGRGGLVLPPLGVSLLFISEIVLLYVFPLFIFGSLFPTSFADLCAKPSCPFACANWVFLCDRVSECECVRGRALSMCLCIYT